MYALNLNRKGGEKSMEELLQKLIAKVYEINENTEHSVFLDFSGHVNSILVHYYENGYSEEKNSIYFNTIYLETANAKTEINNLLKKLELLEG